jgi:hypothetical protein
VGDRAGGALGERLPCPLENPVGHRFPIVGKRRLVVFAGSGHEDTTL